LFPVGLPRWPRWRIMDALCKRRPGRPPIKFAVEHDATATAGWDWLSGRLAPPDLRVNNNSMFKPRTPVAGRADPGKSIFQLALIVLCALCVKADDEAPGATRTPAADNATGVLASNTVVRSVRVSQKLPPYRFVLTPDLAGNHDTSGSYHVGRIEIYAGNSASPLQTIGVQGINEDWFTRSFHTLDINFDGYLDFAVLELLVV
jgi:hypothetical protein